MGAPGSFGEAAPSRHRRPGTGEIFLEQELFSLINQNVRKGLHLFKSLLLRQRAFCSSWRNHAESRWIGLSF